MDAEDAKKLNAEIETIMSNQSNLKNEINRQTLINNRMIERFDNITNHINRQQDIIENYLMQTQEQITNRIHSENDFLRQIQYLNQVNYNIDLLNDHLSNIAEAIMLARLNIISKLILSPDELTEIYYIFKNQSITIKSDEHIYELLGLQAYYNNTNIIFNIQIPAIPNDTYSLFHIISLPVEKTKKIVTKPYAILNSQNIQYFDEKCQKIEDTFYCYESANREKNIESSCIARLINNKPAECQLIEEEEISEIIQPEPNYILLINIPETLLQSSCKPDNQTVRGTVLIHFEKCQIQINEITYEDRTNSHWDEIHIYPSIFSKINSTTTIKNLNLEKLKKYHFETRKAVELLQARYQQEDLPTYGTLTIIICIIIAILIYLVKSRRTHKITLGERVLHAEATPTSTIIAQPPETSRIQFLWPSPHLKEGGVTCTNSQ